MRLLATVVFFVFVLACTNVEAQVKVIVLNDSSGTGACAPKSYSPEKICSEDNVPPKEQISMVQMLVLHEWLEGQAYLPAIELTILQWSGVSASNIGSIAVRLPEQQYELLGELQALTLDPGFSTNLADVLATIDDVREESTCAALAIFTHSPADGFPQEVEAQLATLSPRVALAVFILPTTESEQNNAINFYNEIHRTDGGRYDVLTLAPPTWHTWLEELPTDERLACLNM